MTELTLLAALARSPLAHIASDRFARLSVMPADAAHGSKPSTRKAVAARSGPLGRPDSAPTGSVSHAGPAPNTVHRQMENRSISAMIAIVGRYFLEMCPIDDRESYFGTNAGSDVNLTSVAIRRYLPQLERMETAKICSVRSGGAQ